MKKFIFWIRFTCLFVKYAKDTDILCEKIFNLKDEELNILRERGSKLYARSGNYESRVLVEIVDEIINAKKNGIRSFDEMLMGQLV